MRIHRWSVQLGVVVLLAGTASAQLTSAEFKCMTNVSKAGSKFITAKAKCVTKCVNNVWKGLEVPSDCFAPYGGAFTTACIGDPSKGAEAKFGVAIQKACDPTYKIGTDCPDCYSGGDCGPSGEAGDRVATLEGQMDSFFPALYCEVTPTPFLLEMRCMNTATKGVVKYIAKSTRCYDKCNGLVFKGLLPPSACTPPVSDPIVAACLADARETYVKYIDHDCGPPPASPDGCGSPYPTGTGWVDLVDVMVGGDVQLTYCGSPSGAFLD